MWRADALWLLVLSATFVDGVGATQTRVTRAAAKGDLPSLKRQLRYFENFNQPDEDGGVALVEAARNGHLDTAKFLLQRHASVHVPDPRTGASALQLAVEHGHAEVVQALLGYSADPDLHDKLGESARSAASGQTEMEDLLSMYDARGAEAFENAPGTYDAHVDPATGQKTYIDQQSGGAAATTPPNCAWTYALIQGYPYYYNTVTQQSKWLRPVALCWKYVEYETNDGRRQAEWFNWATNLTLSQGEEPVELPPNLLQQGYKEKNIYWFNSVTMDRQWHDPLIDEWREVKGSQGEKRWYHAVTLETSITEPHELAWREVLEENGSWPFYWNTATGQTQWQRPAIISWTLQAGV